MSDELIKNYRDDLDFQNLIDSVQQVSHVCITYAKHETYEFRIMLSSCQSLAHQARVLEDWPSIIVFALDYKRAPQTFWDLLFETPTLSLAQNMTEYQVLCPFPPAQEAFDLFT